MDIYQSYLSCKINRLGMTICKYTHSRQCVYLHKFGLTTSYFLMELISKMWSRCVAKSYQMTTVNGLLGFVLIYSALGMRSPIAVP